MSKYHVYVDGSSRGNPGPGGWGVAVCDENDNFLFALYGKDENCTNNQMELTAIKQALAKIDTEDAIIFSDSAYCVNLCNEWMFSWKNNGWRRPGNQEVKNLDIIKQIYELRTQVFAPCPIKKVKGHNGTLGNELADAFACGDIARAQRLIQPR